MVKLIQKPSFIYLAATVFSIFLSVVIVSRSWVINPDAVCYLQTAATFQEGFHAAINLCGQSKWPFYSALIALLVHVTQLTYLHAAHLLNGFFTLMSVLIFIGIIEFLNHCLPAKTEGVTRSSQKLWLMSFAALSILFAHDFNSVREYIIRDHGYWAFYLLSILLLLCYFRNFRWYYAWGWGISLIIATLFRIEGIIFLMLMPFLVFFNREQSWRARCIHFFQLNTFSILLFIILYLWFYAHPQSLQSYRRIEDLRFQLFHGFGFLWQRYYWQGNALINHVLGHGTPTSGAYILFVTLLVWYISILVLNLSIIYTMLVIFAWVKKLMQIPKSLSLILKSYVLINALITVAFLGENMFLSKRYVLALILTLMLWLPFALLYLLEQWRVRKWPMVLTLVLIIMTGLGGIVEFGYSKKYIYDAGFWLSKNIPKEATLYTNDFQVMYYSEHFGNQIFSEGKALIRQGVKKTLADNKWKQYDYLALRFTKKDILNNFEMMKQINWKPIIVFANKRGDQVQIFSTASIS